MNRTAPPALLFAIALFGCSSSSCVPTWTQLKEGVVVDREYKPARDTVELRTKLNADGDLETVWTDVHYPSEYWITIEGAVGDGAEKQTRRLQVSKSLYDKTALGSYFRIGNQEPFKRE